MLWSISIIPTTNRHQLVVGFLYFLRKFAEPEIHTVFGDSYLFLCFLKNEGILDILRTVFSKNRDYERILCHAIHRDLKDGSGSPVWQGMLYGFNSAA